MRFIYVRTHVLGILSFFLFSSLSDVSVFILTTATCLGRECCFLSLSVFTKMKNFMYVCKSTHICAYRCDELLTAPCCCP